MTPQQPLFEALPDQRAPLNVDERELFERLPYSSDGSERIDLEEVDHAIARKLKRLHLVHIVYGQRTPGGCFRPMSAGRIKRSFEVA